jgi:aminoglycoside phosphotransferase (APT) family kinase protein
MFYVMGFVEGRILWDPALPDIAEKAERAAIYDAMNGVLATLHDVDYRAIGLADFGKPGNYYERQLSRWSGQYRASETETVPEMEKLLSWLDTHLVPDDGIVSLVHGDYRIDNMIFANDRPEVLAVLDWELSTLGHPYADIAYQCMQWRLPNNSGFRGLGGIDRKAAGIPTEEDYVAAYCARRGLDGIDNWTFYLAFSFFRLAAICQGVYKRSLDGNASNPEKARSYGEAVRLLSRLAVDEIEENG